MHCNLSTSRFRWSSSLAGVHRSSSGRFASGRGTAAWPCRVRPVPSRWKVIRKNSLLVNIFSLAWDLSKRTWFQSSRNRGCKPARARTQPIRPLRGCWSLSSMTAWLRARPTMGTLEAQKSSTRSPSRVYTSSEEISCSLRKTRAVRGLWK